MRISSFHAKKARAARVMPYYTYGLMLQVNA